MSFAETARMRSSAWKSSETGPQSIFSLAAAFPPAQFAIRFARRLLISLSGSGSTVASHVTMASSVPSSVTVTETGLSHPARMGGMLSPLLIVSLPEGFVSSDDSDMEETPDEAEEISAEPAAVSAARAATPITPRILPGPFLTRLPFVSVTFAFFVPDEGFCFD